MHWLIYEHDEFHTQHQKSFITWVCFDETFTTGYIIYKNRFDLLKKVESGVHPVPHWPLEYLAL